MKDKQLLTQREIDKIIEEKYSSSFMNDTKWARLMETLTTTLNEVFGYYKLIHSGEIYSFSFQTSDFKPFFIEPILYKEVEWIAFPPIYKLDHNTRLTRKFEKEHTQDMNLIERLINETGKFMTEHEEIGLKLYAYR